MIEKFKAAALKDRVFSALIAIALILIVGWRFEAFGLQVFVGLLIGLMVREFVRLAFFPLKTGWSFIIWFLICGLGILAATLISQEPLTFVSVCLAGFLTISIWLTRSRMSNPQLLSALGLGLIGLLICVVFPAFEIQTLRLPNGLKWFALHIFIVSAGDVGAYFGGIYWGKEKLMPQISPKKTVAGSFTGLACSVLVGVLMARLALTHVTSWQVAIFAVICGFAAQMGDLLLSLLKRVADVKDSGSIMPGHGGVLDRIDGIITTSPLIYTFAWLAETWL